MIAESWEIIEMFFLFLVYLSNIFFKFNLEN